MMDYEAIVPRWEWVKIVKGDRSGEQCGIRAGAVVKMIGEHDDRVLVRYAPAWSTSGTECLPGDLFWVDKKKFEGMTNEYRKIIEDAEKESAVVDALLAKEKK